MKDCVSASMFLNITIRLHKEFKHTRKQHVITINDYYIIWLIFYGVFAPKRCPYVKKRRQVVGSKFIAACDGAEQISLARFAGRLKVSTFFQWLVRKWSAIKWVMFTDFPPRHRTLNMLGKVIRQGCQYTMMASCMEQLPTWLALCEVTPLVTGGLPPWRDSNVDLLCLFDIGSNKRLNKHSGGRWS